MLKLLLLCWAATIVSAGDSQNIINNTRVPINSTSDNVTTNSQLSLETIKLPVSPTEEDVPVPFEKVPATTLRVLSNDSVTTVKPATTSTIVITTSTTNPTTTPTTKPTTTPTTKSTTTSTTKPITTPTPSTTTPTPVSTTPLPPPSTGKWKVQENNISCIIVQMAAQFNVSYINGNNNTIHIAMDIPSNSNVTGNCSKSNQTLTLSWPSQSNTTQNSFTLHFAKNETDKLYSLHHLEIFLVMENSPTDKSNKTVILRHKTPQFNTGLSNSYRCQKEQSLNLTFENTTETVGQLKVSHLQFQAFRNDNTTVFGLAKDCSFDTPDIVPITVGCALAGLVVVVLIAYLVGRRRSQSRGYLSM